MKKTVLLFFCISMLMCLTGSDWLFAQKQGQALIDSLHEKLSVSREDEGKVKLISALSEALLWSNPDSAMFYAKMQLHLAEMSGWKTYVSEAQARVADAYLHLGNYKQASIEARNAIVTAEASGDKFWIGSAYIECALICVQQGNYVEATEYYYMALKKAEELNDKLATTKQLKSNAYSGIGNVYQCQRHGE